MARLFSGEAVKEVDEGQVLRLPPSLWQLLSKIADHENSLAKAENEKAGHISRNDVIKKVLKGFAKNYSFSDSKPKK